MEINELEEMRSQLSVLNGKLENETIVSDTMLSNATKKSISQMQKKLLIRIITMIVLTPLIFIYIGGFLLLPWCLGVLALNLYIYLQTRKINSASLNVAENANRIHKMVKTYKRMRKILWLFFSLFLVLVGAVVILIHGSSVESWAVFSYCVIFGLFVSSVYYVIDDVFVQPDVVITLEGIIKDLEL